MSPIVQSVDNYDPFTILNLIFYFLVDIVVEFEFKGKVYLKLQGRAQVLGTDGQVSKVRVSSVA